MPTNLTVFTPGVKVPPLFVQFPVILVTNPAVNVPARFKVSVAAAEAVIFSVAGPVKLPVVIVTLFVVIETVLPPLLRIFPAVRFTTILLKVCATAVPLIT